MHPKSEMMKLYPEVKIMKYMLILILLTICPALPGFASHSSHSLIAQGKGSFVFQNDSMNYGRPITILTYRPGSYNAESPILFVMHGNSRTAENYRDVWVDVAEKHNALLLVPHFSREKGFPTSGHYNLGNMFKFGDDDELLSANPESDWSYSLIDPIFDFVVGKMGNKSKAYFIYGHSAGSQFVHRFLFFKPHSKVLKAVCANAGWYTMPDLNVEFPYGLGGTNYSPAKLSRFLERDIIILLGDKDVDTNHRSLRRTPQAMKQGPHRYARGRNFFGICGLKAQSLGIPFSWKLQEVPGAAHSNAAMAPAAGKLLFGNNN